MTPCQNLEPYFDRRLSALDTAAFEDHLSGCSSCRAEVEAWRAVEAKLTRFATADSPSSAEMRAAAERLVQRARRAESEARARPPPWRWVGGIALAAAAAAVLAVVIVRSGGSNPSLPLALSVLRGEGREAAEAQGSILRGDAAGLLARIGPDLIGVSANGRVEVLEAHNRHVRLRLYSGKMALQIQHRTHGEVVDVEARDVSVRVVGTRFMVTVTPQGQVAVAVKEGRVHVSTATGQALNVVGGEAAVPSAESSMQVAAISASDAQELETLLAPDGARQAPAHLVRHDEEPPRQAPSVGTSAARPRTQPRDKGLATADDIAAWQRLILSGDYDGAERALSQHLKLFPRDVEAWSLVADNRRKAGRASDAVKAYRQVVRLSDGAPANRARWLAACILQDELNDPAAAQPLLRAYLAAKPGLRPLEAAAEVRLARSLVATGDRSQATAILKAVMEEHSGTPAADDARRQLDALNR